MHGNSARGNLETPSTPIVQIAAGRLERAMSQKSNMHVGGETDGCVVPTKCPNNGGEPTAEGMASRGFENIAVIVIRAVGRTLSKR
jgi:hypothetical protein